MHTYPRPNRSYLYLDLWSMSRLDSIHVHYTCLPLVYWTWDIHCASPQPPPPPPLQESVDGEERRTYEELIASVGWFFFDLFVLGYVEDPITGVSFRFPGGMSWAVYVEVSMSG